MQYEYLIWWNKRNVIVSGIRAFTAGGLVSAYGATWWLGFSSRWIPVLGLTVAALFALRSFRISIELTHLNEAIVKNYFRTYYFANLANCDVIVDVNPLLTFSSRLEPVLWLRDRSSSNKYCAQVTGLGTRDCRQIRDEALRRGASPAKNR